MPTNTNPVGIVAPAADPAALRGALLAGYAQKINTAYDELCGTEGKALHKAKEIGEQLAEVRPFIKHGQWEDWLRENCKEIAISTAGEYMRLADPANWEKVTEHLKKHPEQKDKLPVRHALTLFRKTRAAGEGEGDQEGDGGTNKAADWSPVEDTILAVAEANIDSIRAAMKQHSKNPKALAKTMEQILENLGISPNTIKRNKTAGRVSVSIDQTEHEEGEG